MSDGRTHGKNWLFHNGQVNMQENNNSQFTQGKNNDISEDKKKKHKVILWIFASLFVLCILVYFIWARPLLKKPVSEPLSLPTIPSINQPSSLNESIDEAFLPTPKPPSNLSEIPAFVQPTIGPGEKPVCGKDNEWILLMVGIDYRGEGYLYGLADQIRVARIDFVNMTVNMIALPRDLLVEAPEGRFKPPGPYKINQSYLFGTEGWGGYYGTGLGAGALAEVIQYNFGVPIDHYVVINASVFEDFIDAIGGIQIDLPYPVAGGSLGDYPAGVQTLDGWRARQLVRIRKGYGDAFRVSNQTIVLKAILAKMVKPEYIAKIPSLIKQFSGTFLTDLSIDQIGKIGTCFLRNFDTDNLFSNEVPAELKTAGWEFLPTLNGYAYVYRWGQNLVDWIHQSLIYE